jgi:hypothetical protein
LVLVGAFLFFFALLASPAHAATVTMSSPNTYFYCGKTVDVTFTYTPDQATPPALRGYSLRIIAPFGLDFEEADIAVSSPMPGINDTHLIIENGTNDYTIDFTFLVPEAGLNEAADLFTITFRDRGFNMPNTPVSIESGVFRTPGNQDIPVDISDMLPISVRCVAPDATTIDPEPEYTSGTTNTIKWRDMWWSGAIDYNAQMSTDPDFATIEAESGWLQILKYQFTGLSDGTTYYFKVNCRNGTGKISNDSNIVQSTQDAVPPTTGLDPLAPTQALPDFDLTFLADDALSGFLDLDLFYRVDGGLWNNYGTFDTSPIEFTATDGDGLYEFITLGSDVAGNVEGFSVVPDASTTLDTSQPYGSFVINAGAGGTNSPNVVLVVSVIRAEEMRFSNDGLNWTEGWVPLAGTHLWRIPTTEETHTVFGEFRDASMQVLQVTDDIDYDLTPPGIVMSPSAAPGHEATVLSWTNPGDPDFRQVEIWRGLVHDGANASTYPTYTGNTVPTAPANRAAAQASVEWELAGLAEIGASSFVDLVADRGIYHYEFFATDPANNYSLPNGELPRATNYILGDVVLPHDGLVRVDDQTLLGSVYGLVTADPDFNPICDVGPTDDGLGTGIPEPDGVLGLEDQMIFGMNYSPTAKALVQDGSSTASHRPALLAWRQADKNTWSLELVAFGQTPKGLGLKGHLSGAGIPEITPGKALVSGAAPFSLHNIDRNGLDLGLVVLGNGHGITNTGSLLMVTLPAGAGLDVHDIQLDLRGLENQKLTYEFQGKSAEIPRAAFGLEAASPNPFNPSTTIKFSIPADLPVQLEIYGMDGRRVAVLVDENLALGTHEAVWLGRDDSGRQVASGVYFSRLQAGPHSQVMKLTLMK